MTRFLLSLLCLTLLAIPFVQAETVHVSGDVSGVWSADSVIVTGEVRVPPQQSLYILPGTQVLFQVSCKFIVDQGATLHAVGTAAEPIVFDRLSYTVHWRGIRFMTASDNSRLEYCIVQHGEASGHSPNYMGGGALLWHCSPTVRNCTFAFCSGDGGGLALVYSNAIIENNVFDSNEGNSNGGGILIGGTDPIIVGNHFVNNRSNGQFGGGICFWGSGNPIISGNTFLRNEAYYGSGGGVALMGSACTLNDNVFEENSATCIGGGIFCEASDAIIENNSLRLNSASDGGGIGCNAAIGIVLRKNLIYANTASDYGGGIYSGDCFHNVIVGNTIVQNHSTDGGGGISCGWSDSLANNIIRQNTDDQIRFFSANCTVDYCNVEGGWAGVGNLDADPLFVDPFMGDFHLTWPSPCLDAGDPNAPLDPDETRADIGCFYFNYSQYVATLVLTPTQLPVIIPSSGGSFSFVVHIENHTQNSFPIDFWTIAHLPGGAFRGPLIGPVRVTVAPGMNSRTATQFVPAHAPAGNYVYLGYLGIYPNVGIWDAAFPFEKQSGENFRGEDDWFGCLIAEATSPETAPLKLTDSYPSVFNLDHSFPNPFNATTAISYQLSANSYVNLRIYDHAGRLVETLVNMWQEAGAHQATCHGATLPSGVYFAKLTAGNFTAVQKLLLLK